MRQEEMLSEKSESEYIAIRKGVGWHPLVLETAFEISGKDAVSFLQGMVSNDVQSLKEGFGCYAACLTPTGKVLSDLRIYALADGLLILLPKSEKQKILEYFDKFIFIEDVHTKDLEEEMGFVSIEGPAAAKLLSDVFGEVPRMDFYRHYPLRSHDMSLRIISATHTGEEGFDILVPKKELSRLLVLLKEGGKSFPLREIGGETLEILRIEAAIPRYGREIDESTILLEAGLEQAVSFTKGCYIGQEVIAKIKNIGHVNRMLVGVAFQTPAVSGDRVFQDGKEVGYVTSSCYSPAMRSSIALVMLRREIAKPESIVEIRSLNSTQQGKIKPLPFYVRH